MFYLYIFEKKLFAIDRVFFLGFMDFNNFLKFFQLALVQFHESLNRVSQSILDLSGIESSNADV